MRVTELTRDDNVAQQVTMDLLRRPTVAISAHRGSNCCECLSRTSRGVMFTRGGRRSGRASWWNG
ncbi:DUF6192 family protein [Streptomyces sp. NPDC059863]|uniref:DUF6192 family protein n=1 Tax=unclassified Streptomyces TaxID=2593676 RepID=UPI00365D9F2E